MESSTFQNRGSFSAVKVCFVVVLFILSLASFVLQTELTSILFIKYEYNDPFFVMLLTHSCWWLLWPIQFLSVAIYKTLKRYRLHKKGQNLLHGKRWKGFRRAFTSSIKTQHRNVAHTAELTAANNHPNYINEFPDRGFRRYVDFLRSGALFHLFKSALLLCLVLNVAGGTWFVAMKLSTGADVTAIYNCSAFAAYCFSIPILHDTFSWVKMSSVLTAISGVMIVAYGGQQTGDETQEYPHRLSGNLIILVGAILYGLYEVLYKRKCCPPSGIVSARREATFSNFIMGLVGINSCALLCTGLLFAHLLGLYSVKIPANASTWWLIWISVFSNAVFSLSFLGLMSLTSPVFSSVSSLLTILLVGFSEWWFRGIALGWYKFFGYCLVMVGFALLTYASWSEISEEDTDDQLLDTDTESSYSTLPGTESSGFGIQ